MTSTLLFAWHKVSSLPPPTEDLNLRFHPDHKYQCPIKMHTWHCRLLFSISITIIRVWKRNNHDIYFTFCMTHKVSSLPLLPKSSIRDSIQTINTISSWHHFFCMSVTTMRIGKRNMTSLICTSITSMRLGKRNNHDVYFTFCMTKGFVASSSYPKTRIWDSIQTINTSIQSMCMYAISSC